jgi:Asp-tRNA(Asn)/Glu-tRNA(Gln) amidotransferase A subunit family amidase
MHELLGLTLIELAATLRTRKASPVELMDAVLTRVEETQADLNAVVAVRDREALWHEGKREGGT